MRKLILILLMVIFSFSSFCFDQPSPSAQELKDRKRYALEARQDEEKSQAALLVEKKEKVSLKNNKDQSANNIVNIARVVEYASNGLNKGFLYKNVLKSDIKLQLYGNNDYEYYTGGDCVEYTGGGIGDRFLDIASKGEYGNWDERCAEYSTRVYGKNRKPRGFYLMIDGEIILNIGNFPREKKLDSKATQGDRHRKYIDWNADLNQISKMLYVMDDYINAEKGDRVDINTAHFKYDSYYTMGSRGNVHSGKGFVTSSGNHE